MQLAMVMYDENLTPEGEQKCLMPEVEDMFTMKPRSKIKRVL